MTEVVDHAKAARIAELIEEPLRILGHSHGMTAMGFDREISLLIGEDPVPIRKAITEEVF